MDTVNSSRWINGSRRTSPMAAVAMVLLAGPARADLRFAETRADAGEARTGIPLCHRFDFVNDGPEPVEITDIRAGCGCLVPRWEKRKYRAGERGTVVMEVNTLTPAPGPHTWQFQVRYRCGEAVREIPLKLSARLVAEISVRPAALTVIADGAAH